MALCHFCKRADFKNGQAVRAHLRACTAYQEREVEEQLYRRWRSLAWGRAGIGTTDRQLRARYEAEQVTRGRPYSSRALAMERRPRPGKDGALRLR